MTVLARGERGLTVETDRGALEVAAVREDMVRVAYSATGEWRPRRSWSATTPLADFAAPVLRLDESESAISVATEVLAVRVGAGQQVTVNSGHNPLLDGAVCADRDRPAIKWTIGMPAGRRYYGFGERTGLLEKRAPRYTNWTTDEWAHQGPETDALYVAIPFFMAVSQSALRLRLMISATLRIEF